jgi:hypothetical protein
MNHTRLNYRTEVSKLAEIITNRQTQNKPMYAIDISRWGISEPFSDCENSTIYRDTIFELSNDTFSEEHEGGNDPHYPNAPYGSIHDY